MSKSDSGRTFWKGRGGQAQTGTSKTAAFGIPILQKVDLSRNHRQLFCPTRGWLFRLLMRFVKLAKYMSSVGILPIYGGQEISKPIRSLKAGVQIVWNTGTAMMDHMRRKTVKFDNIRLVVLDRSKTDARYGIP